ncbi:MAG: hypothetical protein HQL30_08790 [Candidatus Omnitrophica bacterium]|nr:hypothetical protein [Candidatus Omnitrophota bacterium]
MLLHSGVLRHPGYLNILFEDIDNAKNLVFCAFWNVPGHRKIWGYGKAALIVDPTDSPGEILWAGAVESRDKVPFYPFEMDAFELEEAVARLRTTRKELDLSDHERFWKSLGDHTDASNECPAGEIDVVGSGIKGVYLDLSPEEGAEEGVLTSDGYELIALALKYSLPIVLGDLKDLDQFTRCLANPWLQDVLKNRGVYSNDCLERMRKLLVIPGATASMDQPAGTDETLSAEGRAQAALHDIIRGDGIENSTNDVSPDNVQVVAFCDAVYGYLCARGIFENQEIVIPSAGIDGLLLRYKPAILVNRSDSEPAMRKFMGTVPGAELNSYEFIRGNAFSGEVLAKVRAAVPAGKAVTVVAKGVDEFGEYPWTVSGEDRREALRAMVDELDPYQFVILNDQDAEWMVPLLEKAGYARYNEWAPEPERSQILGALHPSAKKHFRGRRDFSYAYSFEKYNLLPPTAIAIMRKNPVAEQPGVVAGYPVLAEEFEFPITNLMLGHLQVNGPIDEGPNTVTRKLELKNASIRDLYGRPEPFEGLSLVNDTEKERSLTYKSGRMEMTFFKSVKDRIPTYAVSIKVDGHVVGHGLVFYSPYINEVKFRFGVHKGCVEPIRNYRGKGYGKAALFMLMSVCSGGTLFEGVKPEALEIDLQFSDVKVAEEINSLTGLARSAGFGEDLRYSLSDYDAPPIERFLVSEYLTALNTTEREKLEEFVRDHSYGFICEVPGCSGTGVALEILSAMLLGKISKAEAVNSFRKYFGMNSTLAAAVADKAAEITRTFAPPAMTYRGAILSALAIGMASAVGFVFGVPSGYLIPAVMTGGMFAVTAGIVKLYEMALFPGGGDRAGPKKGEIATTDSFFVLEALRELSPGNSAVIARRSEATTKQSIKRSLRFARNDGVRTLLALPLIILYPFIWIHETLLHKWLGIPDTTRAHTVVYALQAIIPYTLGLFYWYPAVSVVLVPWVMVFMLAAKSYFRKNASEKEESPVTAGDIEKAIPHMVTRSGLDLLEGILDDPGAIKDASPVALADIWRAVYHEYDPGKGEPEESCLLDGKWFPSLSITGADKARQKDLIRNKKGDVRESGLEEELLDLFASPLRDRKMSVLFAERFLHLYFMPDDETLELFGPEDADLTREDTREFARWAIFAAPAEQIMLRQLFLLVNEDRGIYTDYLYDFASCPVETRSERIREKYAEHVRISEKEWEWVDASSVEGAYKYMLKIEPDLSEDIIRTLRVFIDRTVIAYAEKFNTDNKRVIVVRVSGDSLHIYSEDAEDKVHTVVSSMFEDLFAAWRGGRVWEAVIGLIEDGFFGFDLNCFEGAGIEIGDEELLIGVLDKALEAKTRFDSAYGKKTRAYFANMTGNKLLLVICPADDFLSQSLEMLEYDGEKNEFIPLRLQGEGRYSSVPLFMPANPYLIFPLAVWLFASWHKDAILSWLSERSGSNAWYRAVCGALRKVLHVILIDRTRLAWALPLSGMPVGMVDGNSTPPEVDYPGVGSAGDMDRPVTNQFAGKFGNAIITQGYTGMNVQSTRSLMAVRFSDLSAAQKEKVLELLKGWKGTVDKVREMKKESTDIELARMGLHVGDAIYDASDILRNSPSGKDLFLALRTGERARDIGDARDMEITGVESVVRMDQSSIGGGKRLILSYWQNSPASVVFDNYRNDASMSELLYPVFKGAGQGLMAWVIHAIRSGKFREYEEHDLRFNLRGAWKVLRDMGFARKEIKIVDPDFVQEWGYTDEALDDGLMACAGKTADILRRRASLDPEAALYLASLREEQNMNRGPASGVRVENDGVDVEEIPIIGEALNDTVKVPACQTDERPADIRVDSKIASLLSERDLARIRSEITSQHDPERNNRSRVVELLDPVTQMDGVTLDDPIESIQIKGIVLDTGEPVADHEGDGRLEYYFSVTKDGIIQVEDFINNPEGGAFLTKAVNEFVMARRLKKAPGIKGRVRTKYAVGWGELYPSEPYYDKDGRERRLGFVLLGGPKKILARPSGSDPAKSGEALRALHDNGFVHYYLHPGNITCEMGSDAQGFLHDMDVMKNAPDGLTREQTLAYMFYDFYYAYGRTLPDGNSFAGGDKGEYTLDHSGFLQRYLPEEKGNTGLAHSYYGELEELFDEAQSVPVSGLKHPLIDALKRSMERSGQADWGMGLVHDAIADKSGDDGSARGLREYLAELNPNHPEQVKRAVEILMSKSRIVIDAGCGNADPARAMAEADKEAGVIAFDIYNAGPGVAGFSRDALAWESNTLEAQKDQPGNLAILRADIRLLKYLPDNSMDKFIAGSPGFGLWEDIMGTAPKILAKLKAGGELIIIPEPALGWQFYADVTPGYPVHPIIELLEDLKKRTMLQGAGQIENWQGFLLKMVNDDDLAGMLGADYNYHSHYYGRNGKRAGVLNRNPMNAVFTKPGDGVMYDTPIDGIRNDVTQLLLTMRGKSEMLADLLSPEGFDAGSGDKPGFNELVNAGVCVGLGDNSYRFAELMRGPDLDHTRTMINAVLGVLGGQNKNSRPRPPCRGMIASISTIDARTTFMCELVKMAVLQELNNIISRTVSPAKTIWHVVDKGLLAVGEESYFQNLNAELERAGSRERVRFVRDDEELADVVNGLKAEHPGEEISVAAHDRKDIDGLVSAGVKKVLVFEGEAGDIAHIDGIIAALRALYLDPEEAVPMLKLIYTALGAVPGDGVESDEAILKDLLAGSPANFAARFVYILPKVGGLPVGEIVRLNRVMRELVVKA